MKTGFLFLVVLGSLPLSACESLEEPNLELKNAGHSNLRRGLQNGELNEHATIATPALGTIVLHEPERETSESQCVPTFKNTIGGPAILGAVGRKCNSNSECGDTHCCLEEHCRCQLQGPSPLQGSSPLGDCMDDSDRPATSGNAVAAWKQCSNNTVCNQTLGYQYSPYCFEDADCDEAANQTCSVDCYGINQYCWHPASDRCISSACDPKTAPCPNNWECHDEYTFECGPRVCKNESITEAFEACDHTATCKEDSDCPGSLTCVGRWVDCGVAQ